MNSTPLLFIHQTACDRRGRGYVRRRHWSGGRRATMVAVTSRSAVRPAPESDTASWIPGPHFTAAHALPFLLTLIPSQNFPSEKLKHGEITSLLSGAEKQYMYTTFKGFVINLSDSDHRAVVRSVKILYSYALYVLFYTSISDNNYRPRTLKQKSHWAVGSQFS